MPGADLIPAAVLVPLVDRPEGMTVLLTQRTDHLHDHAGQVSFPGGRVELDDVSHEATALRETEEEVGLKSDQVALVGRLDYYIVRSGYKVTPVVGSFNRPSKSNRTPLKWRTCSRCHCPF
jgi:8-oxo-dGTP pyrophosphatase MutT (NUDIX family)